MNTKTLIATLVGTIASFALGALVFGMLLKGFYDSNMTHYEGLMKAEPDLLLLILMNLCWAAILVYIFSKLANIKSFANGASAAFVITGLITLAYDLFFLAFMNLYTNTYLVVDVIVNAIFGAIIGGIIGWVLGYGNKAQA